MAFSVAYILQRLEEQGLFNIILPILLVFAIVYGILGKINLFGDNDKINAVIAFVFGMYVTMFTEFAFFLTNITAGGMTILVGLLFFLMIVGFGSSLSGGSPTSVLSDHKDALTIVLMLVGGLIFVNSGGLLIIGAYAIRIGFSDVLSLTFLYVVYAVIKSLLGVGKPDYDKVRKLMKQYNRIKMDLADISPDDPSDNHRRDELQRDLRRIEEKIKRMGVKNLDELREDDMYTYDRPIYMAGRYGDSRYRNSDHRRRRLY
ncbi:hypothetical protein GQ472_04975 [archaeon]|nr:hypothetical protein [archaeon]